MLYITYGVLAGLGIGVAYNVVIATVSAWFPDKKGLCSGCLMMGFGASALLLGNLADAMFKSSLGWRTTYIVLGVGIFVVMLIASFLIKAWKKADNEPKKNDEKAAAAAYAAAFALRACPGRGSKGYYAGLRDHFVCREV